jgi:hypothetical protein
MNSKTTITFGTMAIAAVALLFASGPIVGNQQAFAYYYGGYGYHHFFHHHFFHHHFFHRHFFFGFHHFGHFGHFGRY